MHVKLKYFIFIIITAYAFRKKIKYRNRRIVQIPLQAKPIYFPVDIHTYSVACVSIGRFFGGANKKFAKKPKFLRWQYGTIYLLTKILLLTFQWQITIAFRKCIGVGRRKLNTTRIEWIVYPLSTRILNRKCLANGNKLRRKGIK